MAKLKQVSMSRKNLKLNNSEEFFTSSSELSDELDEEAEVAAALLAESSLPSPKISYNN